MSTATYESRLSANLAAALLEGSRHFEGESAVFVLLRKITRRLDELGIPHVVVGGMAWFAHGFRRFTEDVDLLVTPEGLKQVHAALDGLGYVPRSAGSKQLRDGETRVRIEFLVTGQYPGDGKPKPVAFPDPATVGVDIDGIRYLRLPTWVDLKLASGMTGGLHRQKDITDVIALVTSLGLPDSFADQLTPYTRGKSLDLWQGLRDQPDDHGARCPHATS